MWIWPVCTTVHLQLCGSRTENPCKRSPQLFTSVTYPFKTLETTHVRQSITTDHFLRLSGSMLNVSKGRFYQQVTLFSKKSLMEEYLSDLFQMALGIPQSQSGRRLKFWRVVMLLWPAAAMLTQHWTTLGLKYMEAVVWKWYIRLSYSLMLLSLVIVGNTSVSSAISMEDRIPLFYHWKSKVSTITCCNHNGLQRVTIPTIRNLNNLNAKTNALVFS